MEPNLNQAKPHEEFEKCVLCGKQADVNISTPMSERKDYVECCGQLCPGCYEMIHE